MDYEIIGGQLNNDESDAASIDKKIENAARGNAWNTKAFLEGLGFSASQLKMGDVIYDNNKPYVVNHSMLPAADGEINATALVSSKNDPEMRVSLYFTDKEIYKVACSCNECRRNYNYYYGNCSCGKSVAAVYTLIDYLNDMPLIDMTDRAGDNIISAYTYLSAPKADESKAGTMQEEKPIELIPVLTHDAVKGLFATFKLGREKLYKVNNLFEMRDAFEEGGDLAQGTSATLECKKSALSEQSKKWYDFILNVLSEEEELQRRLYEGGAYKRSVKKSQVDLFGRRLDDFYELMGSSGIELTVKNSGEKNTSNIKRGQARFTGTMNIAPLLSGDDFVGVSVDYKLPSFFNGVSDAYMVNENGYNILDKESVDSLRPFMNLWASRKKSFTVGVAQLSDFYSEVMPGVSDYMDITEENPELINEHVMPKPNFIFSFDSADGNILMEAKANYGSHEHNLIDHVIKNPIEAYRSTRQEERALDLVYKYMGGYNRDHKVFVLPNTDEDGVYELLHTGLNEFMELGVVQATNAFKSLNVIKHMKFTMGVSISSGLLDLELNTDEVSRDELLDILKSYRAKKRYHRLKSGEMVDLSDESVAALYDLYQNLKLSPKEFVKGKMHLPLYRTLYLDKLLEANEAIYSDRDKYFKNMVKSFKTVADADYEVPAELKNTLRKYQREGYRWIRTLASYGLGGILADDMGLGKTLQTITALKAAKEDGEEGCDLIVCPASLVFNWQDEFARFAPDMKVLTISGMKNDRDLLISKATDFDVVITSYDLLKRDVDLYEDMTFNYQVIDEGQYIKNPSTAAAKSVKIIKAKHKLALTGTPIENRLSELWSIFDYLMPGFLYGYETFRTEFETPIVKLSDEEATLRLQKMISPFILRRLKGDVLKELPDKLEESRSVALGERQQALYDAQVALIKNTLESKDDKELNSSKLEILSQLTRLRQICCDPALCFENYEGGSAKVELAMDLLDTAIDGGHKVLLFSQFTSMLEILKAKLKERDVAFYEITGATKKEERLKLVNRFNEDDTPVFLISLKAGGVGLNLTGADIVMHYDPWWNVAAQNQATDRAHRIGQTKKVTVYKLIAKGTIEEKIQKLQESKKELSDKMLSGEEISVGSLDRNEIYELLS